MRAIAAFAVLPTCVNLALIQLTSFAADGTSSANRSSAAAASGMSASAAQASVFAPQMRIPLRVKHDEGSEQVSKLHVPTSTSTTYTPIKQPTVRCTVED